MPEYKINSIDDNIIIGTARGCGWQTLGALVNLGAYYVVRLPCAVILTFVFHFGAKVTSFPLANGTSMRKNLTVVEYLHQISNMYWNIPNCHLAMDNECTFSLHSII